MFLPIFGPHATAFMTKLHKSVAICAISTSHMFHTTGQFRKKEIRYTVDKNVTTIEGVPVPSDRAGHVIKLDGIGDPRDTDPISRLDLQIQPTDVRILAQFLRPDGSVLPRSVTGISLRSQGFIELQIERAQKAGLLPISILSDGTHVYEERSRHQFRVYYDSRIIGLPKAAKKAFEYSPPD
ncbi:Ribosomal protein S18 domain-containing protein [Fasciola hepatica]|uniref:Ribosomal protein S18 domain-containing protein n=1 Tax=Fasciola hepatica TaxID=6192 RepID=A0A4E0RJJ1_FASHE|nr:Ribosomal protein S18 domain-containing protein [Fasciola hepatica]